VKESMKKVRDDSLWLSVAAEHWERVIGNKLGKASFLSIKICIIIN